MRVREPIIIEGDIVRVPLRAPEERYATIAKADYDQLLELGLSPSWRVAGGSIWSFGPITLGNRSARQLSVARVLLDVRPGWVVRYLDGDVTNLRRDNLEVRYTGGSKQYDRYVLAQAQQSKLLTIAKPQPVRFGELFDNQEEDINPNA